MYLKEETEQYNSNSNNNNIITLFLSVWISHKTVSKETLDLKYMLDQMDIIVIYRTVVKYITFSTLHGTFSRIEHMLGHKKSINKYKKKYII